VRAEFLTSAADPAGWPEEGPPEIAFAGRSNVGKSSAINALAGRHALSIVSSTPGRTRLLNFFRVVLREGAEICLVDMPGYGYARVAKSARGDFARIVEPYVRLRRTLRAVVVLCDPRREPEEEERDLLAWVEAVGKEPIVVATKVDKLSRSERFPALERLRQQLGLRRRPVPFSARTREGRDEVWARLAAVAGLTRATAGGG